MEVFIGVGGFDLLDYQGEKNGYDFSLWEKKILRFTFFKALLRGKPPFCHCIPLNLFCYCFVNETD